VTFSGRTSLLAVHQKGGGPTKFCLSGPRTGISSIVTRSDTCVGSLLPAL